MLNQKDKEYRWSSATEKVAQGVRVTVTWQDETGAVVCKGSAIVSTAPDVYAPILAEKVRGEHSDLFVIPVYESMEGRM